MNKTDLINKIAEGADLTKVDAKKALDATVEAIKDALKKGDKVSTWLRSPLVRVSTPLPSRRSRLLLRRLLSSRLVLSSLRLLTSNFVNKNDLGHSFTECPFFLSLRNRLSINLH